MEALQARFPGRTFKFWLSGPGKVSRKIVAVPKHPVGLQLHMYPRKAHSRITPVEES
jgi:hypothetical protein